MRAVAVIGALLIVLGIVALSFQTITFFTTERIVDAGPLKIDMQRPHTIILHPVVGAVAIVSGLLMVFAGSRAASD